MAGLTQFAATRMLVHRKPLNGKIIEGKAAKGTGVREIIPTRQQQLVDSKDGEMSEWSIEHAWKAIPATLTEQHRNTPSRNRFSDLRPGDVQ